MAITDKIKRIPLVGACAAWAAWIVRIRRVARAAFDTEAATVEMRGSLSALDRRIAELGDGLRDNMRTIDETRQSSEARFQTTDSRFQITVQTIDSKLQTIDSKLDSKLETIDSKLDSKLQTIDSKLDSKLQTIDSKLDSQLQTIDSKLQIIDSKLQSVEAELDIARRQSEAIRRELMFQQHRLSRLARASINKEPSGATAELVYDQRYDSLYEAFEEEYRGSRADIKQRLKVYLDRLKLTGAGRVGVPVVDIGCGRGEWLELLKENQLAAYGIDINSRMVSRTVGLGLDAQVADLLEHLRHLDDGSRSAVTAFHIVEHLPFGVLMEFLDEALRVLESGSMIILETPNPENIRVGATTFYLDPTHRNPIAPDALRFMVEHRGFCDAEIIRLHPAPIEEHLKGKASDVKYLNRLLFGPRDYAILARRP
jgi:O-antigen chain-terminating methyltransferase